MAPLAPEEWAGLPGLPGERYSAEELAHGLGVRIQTITRWIRWGWLRATLSPKRGYRIRRRAVRRLLNDFPSALLTVAKAQARGRRLGTRRVAKGG